MDLAEVNMQSFYKEEPSILNPREQDIIIGKNLLGDYTFPIQIMVEDSGQTIMQEIRIKIIQIQVSENEEVIKKNYISDLNFLIKITTFPKQKGFQN